jgi:hypothetical protein
MSGVLPILSVSESPSPSQPVMVYSVFPQFVYTIPSSPVAGGQQQQQPVMMVQPCQNILPLSGSPQFPVRTLISQFYFPTFIFNILSFEL